MTKLMYSRRVGHGLHWILVPHRTRYRSLAKTYRLVPPPQPATCLGEENFCVIENWFDRCYRYWCSWCFPDWVRIR
jgi:hypothetical protein